MTQVTQPPDPKGGTRKNDPGWILKILARAVQLFYYALKVWDLLS